jgi:hypothetical protein
LSNRFRKAPGASPIINHQEAVVGHVPPLRQMHLTSDHGLGDIEASLLEKLHRAATTPAFQRDRCDRRGAFTQVYTQSTHSHALFDRCRSIVKGSTVRKRPVRPDLDAYRSKSLSRQLVEESDFCDEIGSPRFDRKRNRTVKRPLLVHDVAGQVYSDGGGDDAVPPSGGHAYALFSDPRIQAMGIDPAMQGLSEHQESIDIIGDVLGARSRIGLAIGNRQPPQ